METDFHVSHFSISKIVKETTRALYSVLRVDYLKFPTSSEEWQAIAQEFWMRWNVPNALGCSFIDIYYLRSFSGSIDGKHVEIRAPPNSGTEYFNYKKTFSTVLLAVCDAKYRVIYAHFGSYGHESDAGIFDRSDFRDRIREQSLNLPPPARLPGTEVFAPYFFLGDGAFPLLPNLQKPISGRSKSRNQRIFNYR
jgi:hypothetical protein